MILFRTIYWDWDLSNKAVSFNETSEYFSEKQTKSFTLPFNVDLTQDVTDRLGAVNIQDYVINNQKIQGFLIKDNNFYEGYIQINEVIEDQAEITIFYGKETLKVFDKTLKQLPFPVVVATTDLVTFAKSQITKTWPQATHNFPKIYRDEIAEKANYKHFEYFVNNMYYDEGDEEYYFLENSNETIESVLTAVNRNVMCPMPYLLEVLKVGFKTEGLEVRGDLVNDSLMTKVIMVPKTFMEVFASSQYENYSFSTYTSQETIGTQAYNIYTRTHTPSATGQYSLKIKVNLSSSQAQYFSLTVTQNNNTLFEAFSQNTEVSINQTLDITIVNTQVFDDIVVEMKLVQQPETIANFNNFTYEYKEGSLNIFQNTYTLADYVPNITFRKLINLLRQWLNLKFDYTDNAVYINYLEGFIQDKITFTNRDEKRDPKKSIKLNENNLFKLIYPDEQSVLVNANGQTYNESDYSQSETEEIKIEVLPLEVKDKLGVVTAVYPEDEEDVMLCVFTSANESNEAELSFENKSLTLQQVYERHWKQWLKYRSNSLTIKETFVRHFLNPINIKEGVVKYNKKMLLKSVREKKISETLYEVTTEGETF